MYHGSIGNRVSCNDSKSKLLWKDIYELHIKFSCPLISFYHDMAVFLYVLLGLVYDGNMTKPELLRLKTDDIDPIMSILYHLMQCKSSLIQFD